MNDYLDFSVYGYRIVKHLGHNREGGRITYLAQELKTNKHVVIKQFQFATGTSDWSGYKAYEKEIQALKQLDHSNIPKYLGSFETPNGFCIVQEYVEGQRLDRAQRFTIEQIADIARKLLAILSYLQSVNPPILHNDIKPENILLDSSEQLFLIDFGFAKPQDYESEAFSSVVAGTIGFIAPEKFLNNSSPTKSSDLYSLGVTLICLLTSTPSSEVSRLIDNQTLTFNLKKHLYHLKLHKNFIAWLDKMVARNPSNRFGDAQTALKQLPKSLRRPPFEETWREISPKLKLYSITTAKASLYIGIAFGIFLGSPTVFKKVQKITNAQRQLKQAIREQAEAAAKAKQNSLEQLIATKSCSGCDLSNVDLTSAELKNANLAGANLFNTKLNSAKLAGAILTNANLEEAELKNANLSYANARDANLHKADLEKADLEKINLQQANLEKANLKGVNLYKSNLIQSHLVKAKLDEADLRFANLESANLQKASLFRTDFRDANLERANIESSNRLLTRWGGAIMPNGSRGWRLY